MKNNTANSAQPLDSLLNDLHTLVAETEQMLGDAAGEPNAEAIDALRTRFDTAQQRCADLCASGKKHVVAGAKYTDSAIRANPYQSIAIAAGIGLLIGVLAGRRNQT